QTSSGRRRPALARWTCRPGGGLTRSPAVRPSGRTYLPPRRRRVSRGARERLQLLRDCLVIRCGQPAGYRQKEERCQRCPHANHSAVTRSTSSRLPHGPPSGAELLIILTNRVLQPLQDSPPLPARTVGPLTAQATGTAVLVPGNPPGAVTGL